MSSPVYISPDFFTDDDLAEVQPLARLLYLGLICHMKRGIALDRPRKFKALILPYDDCDVNELLNELEGKNIIERYDSEGSRYIKLVGY